jgi:hypothetical protein
MEFQELYGGYILYVCTTEGLQAVLSEQLGPDAKNTMASPQGHGGRVKSKKEATSTVGGVVHAGLRA